MAGPKEKTIRDFPRALARSLSSDFASALREAADELEEAIEREQSARVAYDAAVDELKAAIEAAIPCLERAVAALKAAQ